MIWHQGHFGSGLVSFDEGLGDEVSQWWVADETPRFILVSIRHETPYYDDSYAVNSANIGPYGDAITRELMPAVDRSFRTIDARWARSTGGGSTGGWEAAAQMIFYPRLYSGAFVACPDPMDFRGLELVNIYDDPSAFYSDYPENLLADPFVQGRGRRARRTSRSSRRTAGSWRSARMVARASASGTSGRRRSAPRAVTGIRRRSGTRRPG